MYPQPVNFQIRNMKVHSYDFGKKLFRIVEKSVSIGINKYITITILFTHYLMLLIDMPV